MANFVEVYPQVVHQSLSAGHVLVSADCSSCKIGSFGMVHALQLGREFYEAELVSSMQINP